MATRSRFVDVILVMYGIYSVALGVFMMLLPVAFFNTLGAFGSRNNHYIFDNASFELPLGLLLLAAMRWSTWRVPALAFATAHWALHALSHLIDTDHHAGAWVGYLEFAGLALSTVLLAIALRCSIVEQKAIHR
ncbi:MAG: hypothetical protein ACLP3C_33030 [Mycobacterium sp.]|uniref:hypothetical protein n=1 Tax=Mycobacterium sp. TaxID=1785 RepID=UPI003F9453A0